MSIKSHAICCMSLLCLSCQLAVTGLDSPSSSTGDQGNVFVDYKMAEAGDDAEVEEDSSRVDQEMDRVDDMMVNDEDLSSPRQADMEVCLPRNERCNDLDDDCDGEVDESFSERGEPCSIGLGDCQAEGLLVCADSETSVFCDAVSGIPQDEMCDRGDNDCDGLIDEELMGCCANGETQVCGVNQGICVSGLQTCVEESWSECDATRPTEEICDMADNDCDGRVDEGLLNDCGACGEIPIESCDELDNDCDGRVDEGVTNACGDCGVAPSEECDRLDNDCDGRADEGVTNTCGDCGPVPNDVCDGADNDCDGRVDEGVTNACGSCGPLATESCNQMDEDCDGRVDELLNNGPCQSGVGACRSSGQQRCIQGSYECDAVPTLGVAETCNTIDDDCDGQTDENNICDELCNGRDDDGDGQVDEGVRNACDLCGPVAFEICNGVDEDCDGQIDEGVTNLCGGCGAVPNEVCDGNDNDCDGQTDEGVTNACGECGTVPNEVCDGADNDCDGQTDENVLNSCGECGAVPLELCNRQDDDCDGQIDEAFPLLGSSCTNGLGECAVTGMMSCSNNTSRCISAAPRDPEDELCNGLDDDCDGSTDEAFDLSSDILNCGSCASYCVINGDRCVGGECFCGPRQETCPPGLICQNGRCSSFNIP